MLVKRELEQIPILKFPKITAKERKAHCFTAAAQICETTKSGTVFVADIFDSNSRELKLRFFSDGTNYMSCTSRLVEKWEKRKPESILGHGSASSTAKDDELAKSFLEGAVLAWRYNHTLYGCINSFVSGVYQEKQERAMQQKYAKRDEHFTLYPDYPKDLPDYCDRHVFGFVYVFVDKVAKGKRKAVCGHCKRRYTLKAADATPGKFGSCPKCGLRAKYRGMWVGQAKREKAKICIAHKASGQLILRWTEIERHYDGTERRYWFADYYRNLYTTETKRNVPTENDDKGHGIQHGAGDNEVLT